MKLISPLSNEVQRTLQEPLRSSAGTPSSAIPPFGNITREVTLQELLADDQLVPGMKGAYLRLGGISQNRPMIRFGDISQLTINHNGVEFMLTREIIRNAGGQVMSARYRIYSGTLDQIPAPAFRRLGSNGQIIVERIVGHSHPFPVPFCPNWNQPSWADIQYLQRIQMDWHRVYGPQSRPFGMIFGLPGDRAVPYGLQSTHGNAVFP